MNFKLDKYGRDFPFYNNNPKLRARDVIILILGIIVSFLVLAIVPIRVLGSTLFSIINVITLAYACRWDLSLFFKKFHEDDIGIIIFCVIGYYLTSFIVGFTLLSNGVSHTQNPVMYNVTYVTLVMTVIQIVGEEIIRLVPFILVLALVYRFLKNRMLGIVIGLIVSSGLFGLIHVGAYSNLLFSVLNVGLSSMFVTLAYIRTKNIWVSYTVHAIIDLVILSLVMILQELNIPISLLFLL